MSDSTLLDIFLRLGAATLVGMVLGLNRDLHGKPTGIRTLGLVALGVAVATVGVLQTPQAIASEDAYSRLLQCRVHCVFIGSGFLGGGVILRNPSAHAVHNLTTAATVWVTSALGIACAVANWKVIGMGLAFAFALLALGDRFDKMIARNFGPQEKETDRPQR